MSSAWLDYWTTNSSTWFTNWKTVQMCKLTPNSYWDRTTLFYDFDEKEFIVWVEWIQRKIYWELWRLILSPKSFLNSKKEVKTYIWQKEYSLEEITSIIISDFKKRLEKVAWENIDSVLLWRPVKFHDTDETLDILAQNRLEKSAKQAWFKNVEFQFEPIAAANAYLNKNPWFNNWNIIIADLWWWTSDFSIINVDINWKKNVIWNNWVYIWWDELDRLLSLQNFAKDLWMWWKYLSMWTETEIAKSYYHTLSDWKNIHLLLKNKITISELYNKVLDKEKFWRLKEISEDPSLWYEYYSLVEQAKKNLTNEELIKINFDIFKNSFEKEIKRDDFDWIIWNRVDEIWLTIERLLKESGLKLENIDKIVTTWGTSLIPLVIKKIESVLWKWKIESSDTFNSVAYWLTIESYERFR